VHAWSFCRRRRLTTPRLPNDARGGRTASRSRRQVRRGSPGRMRRRMKNISTFTVI
jgi:hypothetical protein